MLGRFIARAVADDILPPKFVYGYKGNVDLNPAIVALAKAETLLSLRHAYTRLDNVWGVSGGDKPTKLLVKRMKLLLEEYLSSNDIQEAARCLRELDVPHFHHEVVYQVRLKDLGCEGTGDTWRSSHVLHCLDPRARTYARPRHSCYLGD